MEIAKNHYLEAKAFQLGHLLKDRFLSLQQLTSFLASILSQWHYPRENIFLALISLPSSSHVLNADWHQNSTGCPF